MLYVLFSMLSQKKSLFFRNNLRFNRFLTIFEADTCLQAKRAVR